MHWAFARSVTVECTLAAREKAGGTRVGLAASCASAWLHR